MSGKYQAYPEYKDSGINYSPQIPKHWIVGRAKYVTDNLDKFRIPLSSEERGHRQGKYPYYGASGVIDHVDDYLFEGETILYGEDGANLLARSTPLAFLADGKYWVNNHAHILKAKDKLNNYWVRTLNNIDITPLVSGSAQPKFTAEALGNLAIAYPPTAIERSKIANFLNHETAKIDTLIEEQQSLIRLLKEKRQAVISHAVTKGLNPDAPMKDSGVEWLGEVPEHWGVVQAKYVADITRGAILRPVDAPEYFDENGEWAYLNISDATKCDKYLSTSKLRLSELGSTKSARVSPDNLIITASATIGKAFINKIKVCVHDGFIPFCNIKLDINYLYHYVSNPYLYAAMGKSNTQKNIYLDEVKNMMVTTPPEEEQVAIVKYLKSAALTFNDLIDQANVAIAFMEERRTALISAAVTGKIDVRDWVAPQPQKSRQPIPAEAAT